MILNNVINEFLEIDGDSIDSIKITEIKGSQIIKYISSYFIGTLKKMEYIPDKYHKHAGFFLRKLMNTVMKTIGLDVKYCNKLLNHFAKGLLSFQEFIEKYNLPEKYFKEYYYAAFSGLFVLIFGKIKNFRLYDTIVRLWILVDNMFDCENENDIQLKKDVCNFFMNSQFLNKEMRMEFLNNSKSIPIVDCMKVIEEMKMTEKRKNGLYMRFFKLFKFSYKSGGYGTKIESLNGNSDDFDILKNSCLKTKKALDIFFYAIDYQKKKEDAYKIFHVSLIIQLLDDLLDIRKDKLEGKTTIFTKAVGEGEGVGVEENTRNAIKLFQFIKNSKFICDNGFQIFYENLIFFFIDYNEEFFEPTFIQKIRDNCPIMDLKYYNMREMDTVVESEIMNKIIMIYLS